MKDEEGGDLLSVETCVFGEVQPCLVESGVVWSASSGVWFCGETFCLTCKGVVFLPRNTIPAKHWTGFTKSGVCSLIVREKCTPLLL